MQSILMQLSEVQAFGLQPGKNGGITLMVKKADKLNKPASALQTTTFGAGTPARKSVPSRFPLSCSLWVL